MPADRPVHKQIPANTAYVQYKGVWDMQDLYEFLASFFSKHKMKFYELKYIVKHPGPFGPETYYVWQAKRTTESHYFHQIDIFIHTYDTQDIDVVMKDGSHRTFTKGRLWIQFRGSVNMDQEGRFEDSAFLMNLRNFYHKYVIWKKIEAVWWDNMYYTIFLKMHSMVKERLKMESEGFEARYFHKVR